MTSNFRIYAIKTQHLVFTTAEKKKATRKERILTILQSPGKTKSQLLIIWKLRDRVSKEDELIDSLVGFFWGDCDNGHIVSIRCDSIWDCMICLYTFNSTYRSKKVWSERLINVEGNRILRGISGSDKSFNDLLYMFLPARYIYADIHIKDKYR